MSQIMNKSNSQVNGAIDIAKLIMAILVIGIHTNPFSYNVWLDRGFGILTRLCVPFFFVASSYFYWKRQPRKPWRYVYRLLLLYIIWTLIYLPLDLKTIVGYSFVEFIDTFLWSGYRHLWFLNCSIIGFVIVHLLDKRLSTRNILLLSIVFLLIGCIKSTWAPLTLKILGKEVPDVLGYRNGLFYAFPYFAAGKMIAEHNTETPKHFFAFGLFISLILLLVESYVFIIRLDTKATILWLSVFPMTCCLFNLILSLKVRIRKDISLVIRKMSTLLYCIHPYIVLLLSPVFRNFILFVGSAGISIIISYVIILISNIQKFKFLKYVY